jgi:hypothetical protein
METKEHSRELLTIEHYLTLSAKINYQLSSRALHKPALLSLVLGPAQFTDRERALLLATFDVLQAGYQQDRRRLGTPGILHPLRAAAILARTIERPSLLDMLAALLHDKDEDLSRDDLGAERWGMMQIQYQRLLEGLDPYERDRLEECVRLLSNRGMDTYYSYLVRILDNAGRLPEILHVKLADRIDNTFDINLQHPGVTRYNFYRAVFDILFMPGFRGVQMGSFHYMPEADEGVMLLSQLFKDTFFLALLRATGLDTLDASVHKLFVGLGVAGIREAQWLALEMFNTCITDVDRQRVLLMSVMQYCTEGGTGVVRTKEAGGELDGMLLGIFTAARPEQRKILTELFQDHELLAKMVLAFIVVFASFINDPRFTIEGILPTGMEPVARRPADPARVEP